MTYTTDAMRRLWSDESTMEHWWLVEVNILAAQREIGLIPEEWHTVAYCSDPPDAEKWRQTTEKVGHEVVAFLMEWEDQGVRHFHIGVTSSDITDTALGMRIQQATGMITNTIIDLVAEVQALDAKYGMTPRLGRTHGQPAITTNYEHLFHIWIEALDRCNKRLTRASQDAALCKVSGPVGNYLHVDPYVEERVADWLRLTPAGDSTQIVMRDALAAWVAELGTTASVIEAIALELRLLSHAQVDEARDSGGSTSSAMPHKVNPNRLERLTGLARMARSAYEPIAAGIPQWHERDMAHSSVERVLIPQTTGIVHYAAQSLKDILQTTHIDPIAAIENIRQYEVETWSHSIMTHLQLQGAGYFNARERVKTLMQTNPSPGMLRVIMNNDSALRDFEKPNIYKEASHGDV